MLRSRKARRCPYSSQRSSSTGDTDTRAADYGTVTLHLKADALALANNAAVANWGPLVGAGTAQPTYVASDPRFNSKPVVRFDGADDVMTWTSANLNARTIFAVTTLESSAAGTSQHALRIRSGRNRARAPGA